MIDNYKDYSIIVNRLNEFKKQEYNHPLIVQEITKIEQVKELLDKINPSYAKRYKKEFKHE